MHTYVAKARAGLPYIRIIEIDEATLNTMDVWFKSTIVSLNGWMFPNVYMNGNSMYGSMVLRGQRPTHHILITSSFSMGIRQLKHGVMYLYVCATPYLQGHVRP